MLSPWETFWETLQAVQNLLFSLSPSQALELKAKTIQLLSKLPKTEYQELAHQITQQRTVKENFLAWLTIDECSCDECEA